MKKKPTESAAEAGQVAFRLDPPVNARFQKVVEASKRTKTSILLECLEQMLPILEKRYAQREAA